jgi:hypothetical protein
MARKSPLLTTIICLLVLGCAGAALAQEMPIEYAATGPLPCGWNLIGFPIDNPTMVELCQVRDPDGTVLSMRDAVAARWLSLPAYRYADGGYQSCGVEPWDSDSSFRPWTGYWIYVYHCGIQIIYPVPIRVPAGSGVMLKSDHPVYRLCPVCDSIPPPVCMCLVVFNTTCVPVTYNFTSGQLFDFEIRDAAGNLVWRWSDGRAFPTVMQSITLNACSMNPVDRVFIPGYAEWRPILRSGDLAPPGLYTLKGWLTADKTMEATITFEISWGDTGPRP